MFSELGETLDCKDKAQCLEMLVKSMIFEAQRACNMRGRNLKQHPYTGLKS